jgi:hypothetical protein
MISLSLLAHEAAEGYRSVGIVEVVPDMDCPTADEPFVSHGGTVSGDDELRRAARSAGERLGRHRLENPGGALPFLMHRSQSSSYCYINVSPDTVLRVHSDGYLRFAYTLFRSAGLDKGQAGE